MNLPFFTNRSKNSDSSFDSRKNDRAGQFILGIKKIYILPTRFGLMYATLVIAMLIGSINYSNNLGYLLTFFLAGLGVLVMYQTWFNLINLQIHFYPAKPVFAGQKYSVQIEISNPFDRQRGTLFFCRKSYQVFDQHEVIANGNQTFELLLPATSRGLHQITDLILVTQFPLGLFRAWVNLSMPFAVLIYPQPSASWDIPLTAVYTQSSQGIKGIGADDFVSHRNYRITDSPKQIDWKIFARERGLMTKQFGGDRNERLLLSLDLLPGIPIENALSKLTRAIIDAETNNIEYGLTLPGINKEFNHGSVHMQACLRHLALYDIDSTNA